MSNLSGTWYNELGSKMVLKLDGGEIRGTYETAVGQAYGTYELVGRANTQPSQGGQAVGFSVAWQNEHVTSHSATSWSGQYQLGEDGEEQIYTLWLLAREVLPGDDWASVQVGQDVFRREPPSEEAIATKLRTTGAPHPPTAMARPME